MKPIVWRETKPNHWLAARGTVIVGDAYIRDGMWAASADVGEKRWDTVEDLPSKAEAVAFVEERAGR